jgi:hypothetical protein
MADNKSSKGAGNGQVARITKVEGLRRALAKLGQDARTEEIQAFLKKRYGIEMTRDHIYVSKGDIRKQEAKKKAGGRPNGRLKTTSRRRVVPAPAAASLSEMANGEALKQAFKASEAPPMTKIEALRQAVKKLGKDATSLEFQGYLKKRFGLEMTREHITKYRGDLRREQSGRKNSQARPAPAARADASRSPSTSPKQSTGKDGIPLEDIQAVKILVGRVGADDLRKLIDVLGR